MVSLLLLLTDSSMAGNIALSPGFNAQWNTTDASTEASLKLQGDPAVLKGGFGELKVSTPLTFSPGQDIDFSFRTLSGSHTDLSLGFYINNALGATTPTTLVAGYLKGTGSFGLQAHDSLDTLALSYGGSASAFLLISPQSGGPAWAPQAQVTYAHDESVGDDGVLTEEEAWKASGGILLNFHLPGPNQNFGLGVIGAGNSTDELLRLEGWGFYLPEMSDQFNVRVGVAPTITWRGGVLGEEPLGILWGFRSGGASGKLPLEY